MESANEAARQIIERYGNLATGYIEDRVSSARAQSDWSALRSWRAIGSNVARLLAKRAASRDGIGPSPPAAVEGKSPSRVLIVEDDAVVAELCRSILADEGYDCAVAHTLASARDEIAATGPDLLLADVDLPDGATGRSLDADARRAGIGILFMSGDYVALRDLAEDGIPHLRKPFRLEELVTRVGAVLAATPRPSPAI
jgi:CheY-like chemotaxis protein